ncbi:type VI secretion system-associated FHA domain protein TagH [Pseudomonas cichorii]|nr:type VI secretion system-associated FHA domain protein TagH [Pseudomonas cichorii]MBX8509927.1 type VI secretion system-associated FHA domain protein TagH [Pseudomonas cichorii]MBX8525009.1 type VI secretion system-associated FHA domain protein TagH [Pseudomonas cichorii]MBX8546417.1 type VI secretion system-associated FHA domain protein TagH [Pseudomonas cichorii]
MENFFEGMNTSLDPLAAMDMKVLPGAPRQAGHVMDHAPVDSESLLLPALIDCPSAEPCQDESQTLTDDFWKAFGEALGINIDHLEPSARQVLALNTARLFRHCISGIRDNLRTRRELKSELQLAPESMGEIERAADVSAAVDGVLNGKFPLSSLAQEFRTLQAHQVAMLDASRTLARITLEQFSPQQLIWKFEQNGDLSLLQTAGKRWRAYVRHYHSLEQDDEWEERLLVSNFAHAYEEQIRLINTLYLDTQG